MIRGDNPFGVAAHDLVPAGIDRNGTLRVFAQGDAGNFQDGGFLLDAAGIRQHNPRFAHELQEIEVAQRIRHHEVLHFLHAFARRGAFQIVPRAGVNREHDRHIPLNDVQRVENPVEHAGVVHVGRPVKRQHGVAARFQLHVADDGRLFSGGLVLEERVDHHVSDQKHLVGGDALPGEVVDAALLGAEQEIADRVGEHAVDFLGHGSVEAAEARLDVDQLDAELHGD